MVTETRAGFVLNPWRLVVYPVITGRIIKDWSVTFYFKNSIFSFALRT
jgi:hypothetical protein